MGGFFPEACWSARPLGMLAVEDRDGLVLVPHRALADLARRATAALTRPELTLRLPRDHWHRPPRRRSDPPPHHDLSGVDYAEAVAWLAGWGPCFGTRGVEGDHRSAR